jgi:quercetin dioxygenase-like cupin family protein
MCFCQSTRAARRRLALSALRALPYHPGMGFIDTNDVGHYGAEKLQKLNLFESAAMFCDVYCLAPGQLQKLHSHAGATKFYFVIEGQGTFTIADETRQLGPGQLAWSAPDEPHGVENTSDANLKLLVAMGPNPNML